MKTEFVRNFYNKMYGLDKASKMNNFLKHFELYRSDVVFNLLEKGERLLDVACGDGDFAIKAREKFEDVYGVDISSVRIKRAIKKAKEKKINNVFFKTADVNYGLAFKDNYFDTLTAIAALAFFFDPFFVISEFKRVLKRGGVLIIEVPNLAYFPRRLALLFGRLPKVSTSDFGWDGGHLHYFTKKSLEDLLKKFGFKIEKVTGSGIFANLRNWWPSLLSGDLIIKARKR